MDAYGVYVAYTVGGWEIALIAAVLLLLFGGRLPEMAKSLGKGVREFKKGIRDINEDIDTVDMETPSKGTKAGGKDSNIGNVGGTDGNSMSG